MEPSAEDHIDCAICLEAVGYHTELPCACTVSYCTSCWDRALAASSTATGQARCPTCRAAVHVDYNADSCRLVFSREDETAGTAEPGAARQEAVNRLLRQARPAQRSKLQQYGREHPELAKVAQEPETALGNMAPSELRKLFRALGGVDDDGELAKEELILQLRGIIGPAGLACYLAWANGSPPSCVCGGSLERVSWEERSRAAARTVVPEGMPEASELLDEIFHLMLRGEIPSVVCDLCDQGVAKQSHVWTCNNGVSTILHATSYDVCESCFARDVCGLAPPPAPPPVALPPTSDS